MVTIINTELTGDSFKKRTEVLAEINTNVYKGITMSAERYATKAYEKKQLKTAKKEYKLAPLHMQERKRNEFIKAILTAKVSNSTNWKVNLLN